MAPTKLFNLLAVTSLAILASTFSATPANALSVDSHIVHRSHQSVANALLKKKRSPGNSKRCKARPSSSSVASPAATSQGNPAPAPSPSDDGNSGAQPDTQTQPDSGNQGGNNGGNNGGSNSGSNNSGNNGGSNNGGNNGGSSAPPPPPPSGRGKAGLAWPINDDNALRNMVNWKISTVYTWSPWVPDITGALGLQGAIMLWGDKQIGDWINNAKPGYAQYAMGFNEPDQGGQSNMDPGHASDLWRQYIDPLQYQGYALVSPACTNGPSGIAWQQQFLGACSGCRIDYMAMHWYGTKPGDMISYMNQFHDAFNKDVWVTEFACQDFGGGAQCSDGDVWNFMQTVVGFMDSTGWVNRYFAFGAMYDMYNVNPDNQLLGGNGYPTSLGAYYIGSSG